MVAAVDGVVGVLHVQGGLHCWGVDLGQLFAGQGCSVLPGLAASCVVAEATGELALGAVDFPVQVVAFEVADHLAVEVQLVQVPAAVVQVVQVLAGGQGERGEVVEGVVLVARFTRGGSFIKGPKMS